MSESTLEIGFVEDRFGAARPGARGRVRAAVAAPAPVALSAEQVFAGWMTFAAALALLSGVLLASAAGSTALFVLGLASAAGCGAAQYTARRRLRRALIERGLDAEQAEAELTRACP